jgi:hypothetical protein
MASELHFPRNVLVILLLVGAGVLGTALLALVVARVVPQELLLASALVVFLGSSELAGRLLPELGKLAYGVVVVGSGWAFGVWCTFDDFRLWPPLTGAAVIAVVVALLALALAIPVERLARRLVALNAVAALLMLLSWVLLKRGPLAIVVAMAFVGWGALRLWVAIASTSSSDEPFARGALILDLVTELAWNTTILWIRVLPDDGGAGRVLGIG